MLVAVRGEIQFFEGGGHPSLEVTDARLVGESAYWQRIQALEATVRAEGLFDDARKTDLPSFPETVGIVTAAGSDAEADLIESIRSRYPGVDIISHDTSVQGDAAPAELTKAIAAVDASSADVLVVTRGGGSDIALRSFNAESVVRAVADATTPTVAAIGHETDTPLVDKVADVRAKTPTAAGAAVVADKATYDEQITEARDGIQAAFATQVSRWQHQQRTGVQDAYETVCAEWLDEQARAIDTATARHTTQWLQETTSDIDTAYTTLVNDWLTEQRSDIQRATTRLEQEHTFEAETAGLRRRNVILVAIIITLLVLLGLALAVITSII
jgi:exodeoxyribonuclease VII large subunit